MKILNKNKVDYIIKWLYYILTSVELAIDYILFRQENAHIVNVIEYNTKLSWSWLPIIIFNTGVYVVVTKLRKKK